MDITSIIGEVEEALASHLDVAADDPAIDRAAGALVASLAPALRQAALRLAEEAAGEVDAQLPEYRVSVVIEDGEPSMLVRSTAEPVTVNTEDLEARLTVRLPTELKEALEGVAGELGDSVNTYIVKSLTTRATAATDRSSRSFQGTIRT